MALISWREFARYLTICMESEPVTYQLFRTIFIENDASVLSTCRTIKSFICQRKLRSNIAMAFMIATMIFILAFPTLVSAMSGYDSNVASRVLDHDDNLIPFNNFSRALYVIHDGWRLNQSGNYLITDRTRLGMYAWSLPKGHSPRQRLTIKQMTRLCARTTCARATSTPRPTTPCAISWSRSLNVGKTVVVPLPSAEELQMWQHTDLAGH
jgi:hypothetical protein